MAIVDFPNAPTLDQVFSGPNGATYRWDGEVWILLASTVAGERVTTAPLPIHFFNNNLAWQTVASVSVITRGGLLLVIIQVGGNVQGTGTEWVGGPLWYGLAVDGEATPSQQWRYDCWAGPIQAAPLVSTLQLAAGTHTIAFQVKQSQDAGGNYCNFITSADNPGNIRIVEIE